MRDDEANIRLIKHVTKRLDEFLDEIKPEEFETIEELEQAFVRFLGAAA